MAIEPINLLSGTVFDDTQKSKAPDLGLLTLADLSNTENERGLTMSASEGASMMAALQSLATENETLKGLFQVFGAAQQEAPTKSEETAEKIDTKDTKEREEVEKDTGTGFAKIDKLIELLKFLGIGG